MIDLKDFKYYPNDGKVRLVKRLSDMAGFYVCDSNPIYASIVSTKGGRNRAAETAYLRLQLNAKLRPVRGPGETAELDKELLFDIIQLANWTSEREFTAFLELCEMHASKETSLSFEDFFYSLTELFQPNKEQSKLNAYGLYCELAFIDHMSKTNPCDIDLTDYWQLDGSGSKYDFVFPKGNFEVKSSNSGPEVMVKHNQLFNDDNNYLTAVYVESNPSGESLIDLVNRLLSEDGCFTTLRSRIELNRRILEIEENHLGKRMVVRFIRNYKAKRINQFSELSDRVTQLTYRLNLVGIDFENEIDLAKSLLSE